MGPGRHDRGRRPEPDRVKIREIPERLRDESVVADLLAGATPVAAIPDPARAVVIAALARLSQRQPILAAVATQAEADRLTHDLGVFLDPGAVEEFPAWETLPFERVSPQVETMGRRLRVMWRLRHGTTPEVVVAPVRALVQRLGPHVEDVAPVVVERGKVVDRDALVEALVAFGYRREYQVEARGEVAVRGSIVDVFPSTAAHPVRIDLWGDEVDRLQTFSIASQRADEPAGPSTDEQVGQAGPERVEIFPCRELLPTPEVRARAEGLVAAEPWGREHWERIAEGQLFDGMESWLPWLAGDKEHLLTDLLSDEATTLLVEPKRMRDRAQELLDEEEALAAALAGTWGADATPSPLGGAARAPAFPRLSLPFDRLLSHTGAAAVSILAVPEGPATPRISASTFAPVAGDAEVLASRLSELTRSGYEVIIAADGEGSASRLRDVLAGEGVGLPVEVAPLEHGFVLEGTRLAVIAETDLTGRRHAHRRPQPAARRGSAFQEDLAVGDYIVHHQHGVGRYGGMVARTLGGVERDYLLLEYRGDDKLYVPTDQVGFVRRYTGADQPTLHRLGGSDWERQRARARAAVSEIAQDLVDLYRRRLAVSGHAFPTDTPWQGEFEAAFPYEETPDQAKAIDDVKGDMEQPLPMDRLVCGDVGYGKTEVALRAAFKAVQDGKQVAVIVPTTLLATQHTQTFRERLASYPVRVEMLSRFLTAKEQRAVVAGLADGSVDIVIATHRLLSQDVKFKDLGLLVVDEEQRFGVKHKERIKGFRTEVDVLTLSATPIPRTLEMAVTGIRDLSLVNTPPEGRQPILTYVGEYDERAMAEAIRRELLREGQAFVVHNRVQDIEAVAAEVRELVPEARVAVAHGQMDEGSLERIVLDFWERAYDVLVCTTIIESGIDMPTVNTLVVDRADLLGLSQMYQLRGRVGRAGQRAYAYLLYPRDRKLTEEAYERLKTIGEFTDLGSGFRIAMRDLEIRGAGNLLGQAQSGHIAAVGFDLYCQMVSEAVAELKGETVPEPAEITIDVPLDAHLPRDYVARDDVRMEAYRRLAAVEAKADVDDIRREWADRFGAPPPAAEALLEVASVRAECARLGVTDFQLRSGRARIGPIELSASQVIRLERLAPGSIVKERDGDRAYDLVIPVAGPQRVGRPDGDPVEQLDRVRVLLAELVPVDSPAS
ncbi:MAG: transcription-repair coupling factor [Actinobacteria bacterium]|nr:transcription-repair coupling factor [Actinomycetota bacterium]